MFEYVLLEMKLSGVNLFVLEVRVINEKVIVFYEKYGVVIVIVILNYYDKEDGYMMYMEVK